MTVTGADLVNILFLALMASVAAGVWRTNATLATIRADISNMKDIIGSHARRLDMIEHDDKVRDRN